MEKKKVDEKQRIQIPVARLSYPHLFEASEVRGTGQFRFSASFLLKKTSKLESVEEAMQTAFRNFWPDKNDRPEFDDLQTPMEDGDSKKFAKQEAYHGHWVLKASNNTNRKPKIVDADGKEILDAQELYAGCYVDAILFASCYDVGGNQGVKFYINSVRKVAEGKKLGNAQDMDFGPVAGMETIEEDIEETTSTLQKNEDENEYSF